jgi:hypothetical protein
MRILSFLVKFYAHDATDEGWTKFLTIGFSFYATVFFKCDDGSGEASWIFRR